MKKLFLILFLTHSLLGAVSTSEHTSTAPTRDSSDQQTNCPASNAGPAQVIIIRHGEKPRVGNELSERGWQRAKALVEFFEKDPAVTQFGPPVAIYAMKPGHADGSVRAIQTVTPLAESLGKTINKNYEKNELKSLVKDILGNPCYAGKTVLICWEHKVIPSLVREFGWSDAPSLWSGKVYDRAWILKLSGKKVTVFQNIPEHVLPGDDQAVPGP